MLSEQAEERIKRFQSMLGIALRSPTFVHIETVEDILGKDYRTLVEQNNLLKEQIELLLKMGYGKEELTPKENTTVSDMLDELGYPD